MTTKQLPFLHLLLLLPLLPISVVCLFGSVALPSDAKQVTAKPLAVKQLKDLIPEAADCLRLRQTNKMLGDCDIVLSKLGLHMIVRKTKMVCLFLPPYNEVIWYNQTSGKVWRCPVHSFRNVFSTSMTLFAAFTLENVPLIAQGRVKEGKLDCLKLETPSGYAASQHLRDHKHEIGAMSAANLILLAADKLPFDPRMVVVLERMYGLPKTGFFPVKVHYQSVAGDNVMYLFTSAVLPGKIKSSEMQVPSNLKPARAMQELLESKSSPEAIDLMMLK